MTTNTFHLESQRIDETVIQMAAFVEEVIARAIHAMLHGDKRLAEEVIATDQIVDDFRSQISGGVIHAIERWAPMGSALRRIFVSQLIADELERIGDYAVHIARSAQVSMNVLPLELIGDINTLGDLIRQQVREGVKILAISDPVAAREVGQSDIFVDNCYQKITIALQKCMQQKPEIVRDVSQLLFTMHDLERVADRVANICENVIYIATGVHEKLN
jgi:phosphate transport system protein